MKKLILSAAIILGSMTAFATTVPTSNELVQTLSIQEEYVEVQVENVPDAIKTALLAAHPDAVLDKAHVNANKEYKLEVTAAAKKVILFADETGKWIQK
ncbi:hypothetical protein EKM05_01265 [Flavobacterium sp. GSP27]|uniref:DUF2874 domain-containing protein n=2 Tax=Flavobacterium TaxID=237 RepID=A0A432CQH2_9FLAO|nr:MULTISPECIES: hypothetical protein [Flavobacterium]RTY96202.1 hypothetical protein EKL32_02325 [Flavobacterium sp. GSN2]RTY65561.1 hypothetical protein EKL95_12830 [Flavobacterium sp. LB2P53]RTY76496.1 hypothetical protein EKL96_03115 [Flavobacterium sp. LS1R10]RTY81921.1 hypothetical protein EKL99_11330 [Flavobacterium sp. ZB4P23]RTY85387.1 hypothetical protein EKL97_01875 [Flavobacterium sp. LS1P28]